MSGELTLFKKFVFGLGCISRYGMRSVRDVYSTIFLLEVAQLPPGYVAILAFLSKGLEALCDIVTGVLLTRLKSRFGKYRPLIICSSPVVSSFFVLLWYVPPAVTTGWRLLYYCSVYAVFYSAVACFTIPYLSLTAAVSRTHEEFDSLSAYRIVFQNIGTLLGLSIIALLMKFRVGEATDCGGSTSNTDLDADSDYFSLLNSAYLYSAIILGILHVVFSCLLIALISEKPSTNQNTDTAPPIVSISEYRRMLVYRPFLYLAFTIFCILTGYTVLTTMYSLYYRTVLNAYAIYPQITLLLYFVAVSSVPICTLILKLLCYGRTKAVLTVTLIVFMVALWSHIYLNYNQSLFISMAVILGVPFGFAQFIPQIMVKDSLKTFSEKFGEGMESVFYVISEFLNKLGEGFCLVLSTVVLEAVGYRTGECEQPHTVAVALRLIIGGVPVIFFTAAVLLIWETPAVAVECDRLASDKSTGDKSPLKHCQIENAGLQNKQSPANDLSGGSVVMSSVGSYTYGSLLQTPQ